MNYYTVVLFKSIGSVRPKCYCGYLILEHYPTAIHQQNNTKPNTAVQYYLQDELTRCPYYMNGRIYKAYKV